jgi:hypothetical protein
MPDEPKKRPWQFSIRDVLLIMLIVGLAVGWFVDHRRLADELSREQQQNHWRIHWFDTTHPVPGHSAALQLLSSALNDTPPAFDPPQPDETITDPPPSTPEH